MGNAAVVTVCQVLAACGYGGEWQRMSAENGVNDIRMIVKVNMEDFQWEIGWWGEEGGRRVKSPLS